ncbi:aldehyde dehydrogenase (NADP(+)) [Gordonia jinhuaensis]|uniref:Aldehyde dehydrogenase n=1 Tax=Gordonia jinhuaensis TaxID=1517702 RepID=A0A916WZE1_9ACTN|nr:aldehyde dehydrogenase (NADP(+)) [Gordonia jinhuaensis]GGB45175.1 aldehyde dehydrogenase [Gordonia jinhuaensis]
MTVISGHDPRTGAPLAPVAQETTTEQVDSVVTAAAAAAAGVAAADRSWRAGFLRTIADLIEQRRLDLIETAGLETGFGTAKLDGEVTRAAFQFRMFADVVTEGGFLEVAIDHAADTPAGPRPDLRRILVALGPVAVFGSSNFPFAFSVLGGDTASALAAGSPVVVKAHPSHPATSKLSYEILEAAAAAAGAPEGVVGIVYGTDAGADLVAHPLITAVGFTGSLSGARALLGVINDRRDAPIPFYGELSSVNPVVVTPQAAAQRAEAIGEGIIASITVGSGQLCTKPGVMLVPSGEHGDRLVTAARSATADTPAHHLLNARIHDEFDAGVARLQALDGVERTACGPSSDAGYAAATTVFETDVDALNADLISETFGPVTVVVRYAGSVIEATRRLLDVLPDSLTATLHIGDDEDDTAATLSDLVTPHAGRVIFNGFPTGVAVSWAQNHGGPWPATNTIHTSVGATAIRRFLRPVTYQNAPAAVLPKELHDDTTGIPRRMGLVHG